MTARYAVLQLLRSEGPCDHVLPVYATRDAAERAFPGKTILELRVRELGEPNPTQMTTRAPSTPSDSRTRSLKSASRTTRDAVVPRMPSPMDHTNLGVSCPDCGSWSLRVIGCGGFVCEECGYESGCG